MRLESIVTHLVRDTRIPGRNRLAAWLYPPRTDASRYVAGVRSRRDGLKMQLDSRNHIDWVTLFHGDFEPEITQLIRRCLEPEAVFVDIGANIGCHALTAASCVGARGHVMAFEPNRPVRRVLEQNVRLNQFADQVSIYGCALGSASGRLPLRVPSKASREGSNMGLASLVALDTPHELVEVPVEPLDDVFAKADLQRCDMIKIDVQGYEAAVLAGMRQVLARYRPLLILEWEAWAWEKAGAKLETVMGSLSQQGYQMYRLMPAGEWFPVQHADNLPPHADLIAIHREDLRRQACFIGNVT